MYRFTDNDLNIRRLIKNQTKEDKDYWSFRYSPSDEHARAFMQYPAMMVPKMQRELMNIILNVSPKIQSVYDPFMGSGTILLEAMLRNKDFKGKNINPLSILICKVKKGPFFIKALFEKKEALFARIIDDRKASKEINFRNIDKWFREDVQLSLSKIRRSILDEKSRWCRRFLWVAFAETVRLTSNSRTSTFKLHIRPAAEIKGRKIEPEKLFKKIVNRNYNKYKKIREILRKKGLLSNGRYKGKVELLHGDSSLPSESSDRKYDLIVTSPPYGDNLTTVTYGQFSYLPLQWIALEDIDNSIDNSLLISTHRIDTESLGGSRVKALEYINLLSKKSGTFKKSISYYRNQPRDRIQRIAAFYRDFNKSLDTILCESNPKAYMIWTIGNRTIGKKTVEMDQILIELLESKNVNKIIKVDRKIPSKRMAIRNNISQTMRTESILIFRRGDA